jgi:peptide/nickel transport system permease protein
MTYWIRRLAQSAAVIWASYTVAFLMLYVLPGDSVKIMIGQGMANGGLTREFSAAEEQELRHQYGYDLWLPHQYVRSLWKALHGDYGTSIHLQRPAGDTVFSAVPPTALLGLVAVSIAIVGAVIVAVGATYPNGKWLPGIAKSAPSLGVSTPVFLSGMLLIQVFSFRLGWFPPFGNDGFKSVLLPAFALAIPIGAYLAQVLTESMRATLQEPYVVTALSKGAGRARVYFRHALKNAMIPTLTMLGLVVGSIFGGAVLIETVFARQGVGSVLVEAVTYRDVPVVCCAVVVGSAAFVLSNLLVDLAVSVLDPRIASLARSKGAARRDRDQDPSVDAEGSAKSPGEVAPVKCPTDR